MTILYYSKINVNSNIFGVYDKELSIPDIMAKVFESLDDKQEYIKKELKNFTDRDTGESRTVESKEIYNFSELEKYRDLNEVYITGKLVRRYPIFSEKFDNKTRKSKPIVHEDNAVSINFYFDLKSEIVTFYVRQKFGYKQFNEAFEKLLDIHMLDIGFKVYLLNDPYKIQERLKMLHKVRKIKSVIIPPNVNEEELEDLFNEQTLELKESNVTRKTSVFETHKKNPKGMNIDSGMVRQTLDVSNVYISRGYGKLEIEGETIDGTLFKYDSEVDSYYNTSIHEEDKENRIKLIDAAKRGISALFSKITKNKLQNNRIDINSDDKNLN
ncbi:hypothetical protein OEA_28005 (plasmid) [Priestia megaterium NCT-2]|uniref:hypothetical protein n=1 Tax=Priestia megaterium TaxID=1404 RepID=UPI00034A0A72|nr:hypothetical protein [Priestia megaterium]AYE53514.1 hypothetical protein OEA_28005 [Priestia megaterium NCT-2]